MFSLSCASPGMVYVLETQVKVKKKPKTIISNWTQDLYSIWVICKLCCHFCPLITFSMIYLVLNLIDIFIWTCVHGSIWPCRAPSVSMILSGNEWYHGFLPSLVTALRFLFLGSCGKHLFSVLTSLSSLTLHNVGTISYNPMALVIRHMLPSGFIPDQFLDV